MVEPDDPREQEPKENRDADFTKLTNQSELQSNLNSVSAGDKLDSTIGTESALRRDVNEPAKEPREGANKSPTLGSSHAVSWDGQSGSPAEKIGRYILLDKLGSGTYGVVHRARDEVLGRFVALKLLTRFERESEVDSWLSEARVLASLDHPSIVPVFDIGKTPTGQPYIVSKLVSGGTLGKRVSKQGCTVDDAVRIATQLADALDYLHRKGVMHRDIKPGNILTTPEGDAILADFGLALDETGYGKGARFVGTPAYMSPEQARSEGHRVDGRSDIYSLGVVFYELLTGTRPFKANNQDDLLDCIRNVEVRPLRQLNSSVPRELERICLKALAKKIADRYSTAGDLAVDLRSWNSSPSVVSTASIGIAPVAVAESLESKSHRSLGLGNIAVVPHGLRPFDSGDSDFFNYLLPGARDRNGVPDCVSFWTHRIASRNPSDTFRVGVLLGPSGSGKSSMIRAGVLPLVKSEVNAVYVEAKPELLEANLLSQLRHALPSKLVGKSLRETLIQFRQYSKERPGKKLVIVIDQFEQWLNHHRDDNTTELHEALRQCDGEHLQAILLVRDDFLLGLSQFMDQIEEFLLQNQNFATVEPFGVLHAKRVLSAFGRAYGVLNENLSNDQEAFLDESVKQLASAGRLAPVQLAVLSEMVKDKPWNIATLKSLGGVEGLGVAFLEERLAGISAHPLMRAELPVVRRILTEMLPLDDTVIKPPACSQSVLLERLNGIASDDLICRLLNLLDTEVRLITPTSSASPGNSGTGSTNGSTVSDPAYQLTHDYLVPTTRKWLESLDAGTRAGRVRQQLREMSVAWNAKPTAKRLPSLAEWSAIRWFVKPTEWTSHERRMLRATEWRLGQLTFAVSAILAIIAGVGFLTMREIQSQTLADRVLEADTGNIATVLNAIEPYQATVLPRLAQIDLNAAAPETLSRRKLHFALANFETDPSQAEYVLNELHTIEDRHLSSVVAYLSQRTTLDNEQLLARLRSAVQQNAPSALALAALFSSRQPEHDVWTEIAHDVTTLLVGKRNTQINYWPELLMPARNHLLPAIVTAIESSTPTAEAKLDNHLFLLTSFAQGDASILARAVGSCPPELLTSLFDQKISPVPFSIELRKQLAKLKSDPQSGVDEAVAKKLSEYGGQITSTSAWAPLVPWDQLQPTISQLREAGYSPVSLRPFKTAKGNFAAISWNKSADAFEVATDLDQDSLRTRFNEKRDQGFVMLDLANDSPSDSAEVRWTAVWHKPTDAASQYSQLLTIGDEETDTGGFLPCRVCTVIDDEGDCFDFVLWNRSEETTGLKSLISTRTQRASGDLYPAFCYSDLRYTPTATTNARGENWLDYQSLLERASNPENPTTREQIALCTQLSACGKAEEAAKRLEKLTDADFSKLPESSRNTTRQNGQRQLAYAYARLKKTDDLQRYLDETIRTSDLHQAEKDFLDLRLALLKQELPKADELLIKLEKTAGESSQLDQCYLRALALVAAQASEGTANASADAALQKLIARTPGSLEKDESISPIFFDVDFDGVRTSQPWRQLLDSVELSQLVTLNSDSRTDEDSRVIFASPIAEHSQSALQLSEQGFAPTCVNCYSDQRDAVLVSSIWRRPKRSASKLAAEAQRNAMLILSLARLGEIDEYRYGLEEKAGRGVQSALIVHSPSVLPSERIVAMLRETSSAQLQSVLVSVLGGYSLNQLSEENRQYITQRLEDWASKASSASLLSNAQWCLNQWKLEPKSPLNQPKVSPDTAWFTTSLGQPMVVIKPPELVLAGKEDERRVWTRIGRTYALSAHEVTGAEYAEFLKDPRVVEWINRDRRARNTRLSEGKLPQLVSWLHAVRFCQWLSEREQIPEAQWCYGNVWQDEQNITLESDYLDRSGYRLPTLAEREYACAAGSEDIWHFGNDPIIGATFEWTLPHSNSLVHKTGEKRPNNFGLFDMAGNLSEWVNNSAAFPLRARHQYFMDDNGLKHRTAEGNKILSGGRFKFSEQSAVSNYAVYELPDYLSSSTGFRVARTIAK